MACTEGAIADEFEWSRWRAFFVAFDSNNVVIAAKLKHLSASMSLDAHLDEWAQKHRAAPDRIDPESFAGKQP